MLGKQEIVFRSVSDISFSSIGVWPCTTNLRTCIFFIARPQTCWIKVVAKHSSKASILMNTYPHGTELVTPSCDQTSDSTVPGYGTGEVGWCWDQWCCCRDESLTHLADPCFQAPCFQAPQTHTPSHQTLQKWETFVSQSHPTPSKSYELLQFHKYIAWWIESLNLLSVMKKKLPRYTTSENLGVLQCSICIQLALVQEHLDGSLAIPNCLSP